MRKESRPCVRPSCSISAGAVVVRRAYRLALADLRAERFEGAALLVP
jgi:hypothetical protein